MSLSCQRASSDLLSDSQANTYFRNPNIYGDLISLDKRVKLCSHSVSSSRLISASALVVTLTGTVAKQAALSDKPVLTLGASQYDGLYGIYSIDQLLSIAKTANSPVDASQLVCSSRTFLDQLNADASLLLRVENSNPTITYHDACTKALIEGINHLDHKELL